MNHAEMILEFTIIKEKLCGFSLSEKAQERLAALTPYLSEGECLQKTADTTAARTILDAFGSPPLTSMKEVEKLLTLCAADSMLLPEQLLSMARFCASCRRMTAYLKRAESLDGRIASYGGSILDLSELQDEIERCIRNEQVDSDASPALRDIRRKIENTQVQVKEKLGSILQSKKNWFSDGYVSQKNGRFVLPVKKEFKSQFAGSVVDVSGSGSTYFMEPSSVTKLQSTLSTLQIEEDNEVRRILYTLTALVSNHIPQIKLNMEALVELDFVFAKAKLSADMDAVAVTIGTERKIRILKGRHPLLDKKACVPLDFEIGGDTRGVIITGPNTGGKTVTLKTVGLLSVMAQCGLHVPADKNSYFAMHNAYWCDIGDGQSITQNLSTFSGHMTNIIGILEKAGPECLILLDELGSGTDPAEGMGIAVAVLEELRQRGCLFLVTTHYPQVKDYAEEAEAVMSARMAFDRETLSPLYMLELGMTGESCALYIAQRLGLPAHLLRRAYDEAYRNDHGTRRTDLHFDPSKIGAEEPAAVSKTQKPAIKKAQERSFVPPHAAKFNRGDSVIVYPEKELGIVFQQADKDGMVGVQVKGKKKLVSHKRVKLKLAAAELYPEDYDLSVVLDSVANRKARHQMSKRHRPDLVVSYDEAERQ